MKSIIKMIGAPLALLISLPATGMQQVSHSSNALIKSASEHPLYAAGIVAGSALGFGAAYLHYQGKLGSTLKDVKAAARSKQAKQLNAYVAGFAFPIVTGSATLAVANQIGSKNDSWRSYAMLSALPMWYFATSKGMNLYARFMALDENQEIAHVREGKNRQRMGDAATLSVILSVGSSILTTLNAKEKSSMVKK